MSKLASKASGRWCCGGWRSSLDVPSPWELSAARHSSACPEIRWRVLSPSSTWCGRRCWRWQAPRKHPIPMPVRAAFSYKKKIARREYVRVHLRESEDGVLEAVKFPREGAGLLSSLVNTDGLVELGEAITQVEPGQTVGFLSYASLM